MENTNVITTETAATENTKVMAKSGFMTEPKISYGGDVLGILVSIGLIIGGASGKYVLRGTDSSSALTIVGIVLLIWDVISIFRKKSAYEEAVRESSYNREQMHKAESEVMQDARKLAVEAVEIRLAFESNVPAISYVPRINRIVMKNISSQHPVYTASTTRVCNILSFDNLNLMVKFDITDSNTTEIELRIFIDKGNIGVELPKEVSLCEK